jgi:hypothetical protein
VPDVRIARSHDPDVNNDSGDDLEVRSATGVWAGDVDAVALTATTWPAAIETAVDGVAAPACSPASGAVPALTGDARLATVRYRVGDLSPGATARVRFVYRVQ